MADRSAECKLDAITSTCAIPRDAWTIVQDGWTPHELFRAGLGAPQNATDFSVLLGQPSMVLEASLADRLCPAASRAMSFEVLHHVFSPERRTEAKSSSEKARGCILSRSHCRMSCVVQPGADAVARPNFSWPGKRADVLLKAPQVEVCFLVTTMICGRRFVVRRAQSHVFMLLKCAEQAFPQFLFPALDFPSEARDVHVEHLMECVAAHSEDFSKFPPALFFFFELDLKEFANGLGRVVEQSEMLEATVAAPVRQLQVSPQPLFCPSVSQRQPATPSLGPAVGVSADDVEVLADHHDEFPKDFLRSYSLATHVALCCQDIVSCAAQVCTALECENEEFSKTADELETFVGEFGAPPPCLQKQDEAEFSRDNCALQDVSATCAGYMGELATELSLGALPLIRSMLMSANHSLIHSLSLYSFHCRGIFLARSLHEYKVCAASLDEGASEQQRWSLGLLSVRRDKDFKLFQEHFAAELERQRVKQFQALRSVCFFVSVASKHLGASIHGDYERKRPDIFAALSLWEPDIELLQNFPKIDVGTWPTMVDVGTVELACGEESTVQDGSLTACATVSQVESRSCPTEPKAPAAPTNTFRSRVSAILEKYDPSKVHQVDALMGKYEGKERAMIAALVKRYGPEPDQT